MSPITEASTEGDDHIKGNEMTLGKAAAAMGAEIRRPESAGSGSKDHQTNMLPERGMSVNGQRAKTYAEQQKADERKGSSRENLMDGDNDE